MKSFSVAHEHSLEVKLSRIAFLVFAILAALTFSNKNYASCREPLTPVTPKSSSPLIVSPLTEPVYFGHIYTRIPEVAFNAIMQSDFIKLFAGMRSGTSKHDNGEEFAGLYIYGFETYFELLSDAPDKAPDYWGDGIGFHTEGGFGSVFLHLKDTLPYFVTDSVIKKEVRGKSIRAYRIGFWVMEYHPDLFGPDITRRAHNSKRYRPEGLLKDIEKLIYYLPKFQRERLKAWASALSYRIETVNGVDHIYGLLTDGKPAIEIELRDNSDTTPGLSAIEFSINDVGVKNVSKDFGAGVKIEIGDNKGIFHFR